MSYKTELQSNNVDLQSILAKVNALPEYKEGIDTSDATATAEDIASGKTAYVNGEKVEGNVYDGIPYFVATSVWDDGENVYLSYSATRNYLARYRKESWVRTPYDSFGDATEEDVVAGKTFTSASGLKTTGTHKCSGGLPSGVSAVATGTFTPTSDITTSYIVNHEMGIAPNFVLAWIEDEYVVEEFEGYITQYISIPQLFTSGSTQYYGLYGMTAGHNNYHICTTVEITESQVSQYFTPTSFTIRTNRSDMLKAGFTYRWVAGVIDGLN